MTTPGSPVDLDTRHGDDIVRTINISSAGAASNIEQLEVSGVELTLVSPPSTPFTIPASLPNGAGSVNVQVRYSAVTFKPIKAELGKLTITHDLGKADAITLSGQAVVTSLSANPA